MAMNVTSIFNTGTKNISEWTKQDFKLYEGVKKGNTSQVKSLLLKGADPTKLHKNDGSSSFHSSVLCDNLPILKLITLHTHSLDINAKDFKERTALQIAICRTKQEMAEFLIEKGSDLTTMDVEDQTLMHSAVLGGNIGCVQILLRKNSPADWPDKAGFTPLHYAVEKNQATNAKLLIENGAFINKADPNGKTVLMYAVEKKNTMMCTLLLKSGADVGIVDKEEHTALWYAEKLQCHPIMKLLNGTNENGHALVSNQTTVGMKEEQKNQVNTHLQASLKIPQEKTEDSENNDDDNSMDESQNTNNDPFNRRYAKSYKKLKDQVEFENSDELVTNISDTLTRVYQLTAENDALRKEVTELENIKINLDSKVEAAESTLDTYGELASQKDVLYEENQHLKKSLSRAISDPEVFEKIENNFYNHDITQTGNKKSIELNALQNHIKSYKELENKYKESLICNERLKRILEENNVENDFSTNSADENFQKLKESYDNRMREDLLALLDSYKSLVQENSLKTSNLDSNLPEKLINSDFIYDTIKQDNDFQTSDYPSLYSNSDLKPEETLYLQHNNANVNNVNYGEVEIQRDLLMKEVDSLKMKINTLNKEIKYNDLTLTDKSANGNVLKKKEISKQIQTDSNMGDVEDIKQELYKLKKENDENVKNSKEILYILQHHYIEYFTDTNSYKTPEMSSDLKTMVDQITMSNANLIEKVKEQHEICTELKEELCLKNKKIAIQEKSLESFGNVAVENDKLEKDVNNLKFLINENNFSFNKNKTLNDSFENQTDVGGTSEFVDDFVTKNAFIFVDEKTKEPIESCFDQIFKLETIKNELINKKEILMSKNNDYLDEIKKLKQENEQFKKNVIFQNNDGKRSTTPSIILTNEEHVFSEDLVSMDELGELFVKKDVLEREIENLRNVNYLETSFKEKKNKELNNQLNQINNSIRRIDGSLNVAEEDKITKSLTSTSKGSNNNSPKTILKKSSSNSKKSPQKSQEIENDLWQKDKDKNGKALILYLQKDNKYLYTQIEGLNKALSNNERMKDKNEGNITSENNNFSSSLSQSQHHKKEKSTDEMKDFIDKLENENDRLKMKLYESHEKVKQVLSNLKAETSVGVSTYKANLCNEEVQSHANAAALEKYSEIVKNFEKQIKQQEIQLENKNEEIKNLNKYPGELQSLSIKYKNLSESYEKLKNIEKINSDENPQYNNISKKLDDYFVNPETNTNCVIIERKVDPSYNSERMISPLQSDHKSVQKLSPIQQASFIDREEKSSDFEVENFKEKYLEKITENKKLNSKVEKLNERISFLLFSQNEVEDNQKSNDDTGFKNKTLSKEDQSNDIAINDNTSTFDVDKFKDKYLETFMEKENLKLKVEELSDRISFLLVDETIEKNHLIEEKRKNIILIKQNEELNTKLSHLDTSSRNKIIDLEKEIDNQRNGRVKHLIPEKIYNETLTQNNQLSNQQDSMLGKHTRDNLNNEQTRNKEKDSSFTSFGAVRQISSIRVECQKTVPVCVCEASDIPLNEYLLSNNYICKLKLEIERLKKELSNIIEKNNNLNKELKRLSDQKVDYKFNLKENIELKKEITELNEFVRDHQSELQNNSKNNYSFDLDKLKTRKELEVESELNKLVEVISKENSELKDSLQTTQAELASYKVNKSNESDKDENKTLRNLNRQLSYEVSQLQYSLSEEKKTKKTGINYREIENKKLIYTVRKQYEEEIEDFREQIYEYDTNVSILKNENINLEINTKRLNEELEVYKNARKVSIPLKEEINLREEMRKENQKLQHFLDLLNTVNQVNPTSEETNHNMREHQDENNEEIIRLMETLKEKEIENEKKIVTYQEHLLSSFQGTMAEDVKKELEKIVRKDLKQHYST